MTKVAAEVACPSIAETLAEFLAEQEKRLAPRTFRGYHEVVDLLQHNLNGYAYQTLNQAEAALFDRLYEAKGVEHREFCEIFGPERSYPRSAPSSATSWSARSTPVASCCAPQPS